MTFLREYWAWILVPWALFMLALALLLVGGGGGASPFVYNVL